MRSPQAIIGAVLIQPLAIVVNGSELTAQDGASDVSAREGLIYLYGRACEIQMTHEKKERDHDRRT